MDIRNNPYSPGAGRKPVALVGRDVQIETWGAELSRIEKGLDSRPLVLYGLRGVGKTVLLSHMHEIAMERKWISARFEANRDKTLRELICKEFEEELAKLAAPNAGQTFLKALKTILSFRGSVGIPGGFSFGLDLSDVQGSNAGTGDFERDLLSLARDLSDVAKESKTGVSILIDEAQDLSEVGMSAISELIHRATQDGVRLVVALAGLPSLPGLLSKAKSYAERLYAYHKIEALPYEAAMEALVEPAHAEGVEWQADAVNKVISLTVGYPYFLQEYGSACWIEAKASPIRAVDVKRAAKTAIGQLDIGFFRSRWDRVTDAQKAYLRAMAVDGDTESSTKDIANRLGQTHAALTSRRAELIGKGLIYPSRHGFVAFTVPLMADFVGRQLD
ncbi:MAG: ATP-binding protein [Clostridiales Family XIII bacterium]|jgi:hypothetical protein|nr:ATP-binding protein [Clostridiales Family XIII bacterium]